MNDEQKQVFYETYYCGKMISQLATQLNKTEEAVKKILNEAFTILRRGEN
jgi:DNA-directed RNA polymerase specialized sigma24 family protein